MNDIEKPPKTPMTKAAYRKLLQPPPFPIELSEKSQSKKSQPPSKNTLHCSLFHKRNDDHKLCAKCQAMVDLRSSQPQNQ